MDDAALAVTWAEFGRRAPELAAVVRGRLTAAEHHVLATLRADGSPRVNGTNVLFDGDDLLIGCMPGTRRGLSADAPTDGELFALRLRSVSTVKVEGEHLRLQVWTPATGVQSVQRG